MLIFTKLLSRLNLVLKVFTFSTLLSVSAFLHAELEELDDKKLEEQTAKEGITIDLSYKLSIKEILFDFSDNGSGYRGKNRNAELTPPPPRIEYIHGND